MRLLLSGILGAVLMLVAVQVASASGLLYRYYIGPTHYREHLAQGCEPLSPKLEIDSVVRCPFWVQP